MPAADEVYRLQTDDDADCRFFRRAVRGREEPSGGTMQGTYVFAPSGLLLGRLNSNNPEHVLAMMEAALEKWKGLDQSERRLGSDVNLTAEHRWEQSYPQGGLVLMRTARDLPVSLDPGDERAVQHNRDPVWLTREEALGWVPAEIGVGARRQVDSFIVERLARFHLVDNVRGQTIPYAASEVKGKLTSEVVRIEGDVVSLRISGWTEGVALGPWLMGENYWKPGREDPHSITTEVLGNVRFDRKLGEFVSFDVVVLGVREGRTINNGRRETTEAPIGFAMEIAPVGYRIAPTFINMYDAKWVRQARLVIVFVTSDSVMALHVE